jgi:hypothetical protein
MKPGEALNYGLNVANLPMFCDQLTWNIKNQTKRAPKTMKLTKIHSWQKCTTNRRMANPWQKSPHQSSHRWFQTQFSNSHGWTDCNNLVFSTYFSQMCSQMSDKSVVRISNSTPEEWCTISMLPYLTALEDEYRV